MLSRRCLEITGAAIDLRNGLVLMSKEVSAGGGLTPAVPLTAAGSAVLAARYSSVAR